MVAYSGEVNIFKTEITEEFTQSGQLRHVVKYRPKPYNWL